MIRRDQSMDLLASLYRDAIDPEYFAHHQRRGRRRHQQQWGTFVVLLVAGLLLGAAAHDSALRKPAAAKEREELISQVDRGMQHGSALAARANRLGDDVAELQRQRLGPSESALASRVASLEVAAASTSVSGPAFIVEVDDAPSTSLAAPNGRVVDIDLRQAVNGLWAAGAEAISVNGHRIGPTTAIRSAGQAITVNYRSLVKPYKIIAIGQPGTLESRFQQTSGGSWLQFLRQNYDVIVHTSKVDDVRLDAVSVRARHAVWKES